MLLDVEDPLFAKFGQAFLNEVDIFVSILCFTEFSIYVFNLCTVKPDSIATFEKYHFEF